MKQIKFKNLVEDYFKEEPTQKIETPKEEKPYEVVLGLYHPIFTDIKMEDWYKMGFKSIGFRKNTD